MTPREKMLRDALEETRKTAKAQCQNYDTGFDHQYWLDRLSEINTAIEKADAVKDGPNEENKKWLEGAEHKYCGHMDDCPVLGKDGDKTPDMCRCNAYAFRAFASKLREAYSMEQRYF